MDLNARTLWNNYSRKLPFPCLAFQTEKWLLGAGTVQYN
jgi:hypothetical protein